MLLKKAQAELAIRFQTELHSKNTYNEPCTPDYVARMQAMKLRMNQLNRKGKGISPATTERDDTRAEMPVKRQSEHSEETGVSAAEMTAPVQ